MKKNPISILRYKKDVKYLYLFSVFSGRIYVIFLITLSENEYCMKMSMSSDLYKANKGKLMGMAN